MRNVARLLLVGLAISPALAQKVTELLPVVCPETD